MTSARDLDGRVAQGWGGSPPNGVHVNLIVARRASPTAAAMTSAFSSPGDGFVPILVCAGPDQQSYETLQPPTVILPKARPSDELGQTLISGAVQVGTARAVLNCVADGLLAADQEHLIFVSVWLDAEARDETAVRDSALEAVSNALTEAISGRSAEDIEQLVAGRERLTHPFYNGH